MGAVIGALFMWVLFAVGLPVFCLFDWYLSKDGRGKITFKEYMERF